MKMSDSDYRLLRDGFKTYVEAMGGLEGVKSLFADTTPGGALWGIYHKVFFDWRNDDQHPVFVRGRKRLLDHRPGWDMYHDGLDDTHYATALRRIGTELGLTKPVGKPTSGKLNVAWVA